jgi:hypothetical protein
MLVCANCGVIITDELFVCNDNTMQVKFFQDIDGKDNMFCSESCFANFLSVDSYDVSETGICKQEPSNGFCKLSDIEYCRGRCGKSEQDTDGCIYYSPLYDN